MSVLGSKSPVRFTHLYPNSNILNLVEMTQTGYHGRPFDECMRTAATLPDVMFWHTQNGQNDLHAACQTTIWLQEGVSKASTENPRFTSNDTKPSFPGR